MELSGILAVFQMPYDEGERIDYDTLGEEIDWLFEQGADGLVMAMVSEVLRLSEGERREVAEFVVKVCDGRGPVVISVGAESSRVACAYARHAEEIGATAVMAIPPVSISAGEDELKRYYERLLKEIQLPVIVQDASNYVGKPMPIKMQAGLWHKYGERVMFKPEAAPLGPRLTEMKDACGGGVKIFEGSGGIALVESFKRGISGTMPGSDLIKAIVALWRALNSADKQRVDRIAPLLMALISMQDSLDSYLAIEKHLLVKQGVFKNTIVRGPVGYVLDDITRREIDDLFGRLMAEIETENG